MSTNWTGAWVTPGVSFFVKDPADEIFLGGLILTDKNGALAANGVEVAATWSLYPAINDELFMNSTDRIRVIAGDLYFNNELIATQSNISNVSDWSYYPAIQPVEMIQQDLVWEDLADPQIKYVLNASTGNLLFQGKNVDPTTWSVYPALQNVNFSNYNLTNGGTLNCKQIFGNGTSNANSNILELLAYSNIYVKAGELSNIASESKILLQTTGGSRGRIVLEAVGGANGLGNPGIVDIIAEPTLSPDGSIGYGGTVNVIANSAIGTNPALTQTSKVVVSGASVLSYAGFVNPILSTEGYNYIWGSLGVNIQSDVVPPIVPNTPGTVYLYGRLGVAVGTGTVLGTEYGLFASLIQPYSDGISRPDLFIKGKFSAKVRLQDVSEIVGSSCAMTNISTINGVPYVSGSQWSAYPALQNVNFSNFSLSNVSNVGCATINGVPYVSGSAWSSYPATQNVNMSNFTLSNVSNILTSNVGTTTVNGVAYIPTTQWATQPAVQTVNVAGFSLDQVNTVRASTASLGLYATNVSIFGNATVGVLTPTLSNELCTKFYVDSLASTDWAQYPAVQNVNMAGFSISNLLNVNGSLYVPTASWASLPATASVNMANRNLSNVSAVIFGGAGAPFLQVAAYGAGTAITTTTPFVNLSFYTTDVLVPTLSNELCCKKYVDSVSQVTTLSGTTTIVTPALTAINQIIGKITGVVVPANQKLMVNATFTVQTSSNTNYDVVYFVLCNGVILGQFMTSTFSGIGHYGTCAITAISGALAAGTYTLDLYARTTNTGIYTVTQLNFNTVANLA
jgi:hypothetical protein